MFCDGGARGNPGPAAAAFVSVLNGKVIARKSKYLGKTTNNVAEYTALILALKWLVENRQVYKGESVFVSLDSQLVAKQITGEYKTKDQRLKDLLMKAKNLESRFPGKILYRWAPRKKNRLADFLVNKELNSN